MMSPGRMPYRSVSSCHDRCAISSLRSRVIACACSLSSSMQPTTSAAPYARASGVTRSNFSSPSSRLIELMIDLPWQYVSARSSATGSVVSIMIGTRTFFASSS